MPPKLVSACDTRPLVSIELKLLCESELVVPYGDNDKRELSGGTTHIRRIALTGAGGLHDAQRRARSMLAAGTSKWTHLLWNREAGEEHHATHGTQTNDAHEHVSLPRALGHGSMSNCQAAGGAPRLSVRGTVRGPGQKVAAHERTQPAGGSRARHASD